MVIPKHMAGRENGLTLIELLVTMAIMGFVITAIYSFYLSGLSSWQRSSDHLDHSQNARIAMDKIIKELRYASEAAVFDQGREIRFKAPHDPNRTLRFRLVGSELVFDSYPTGSLYYFNNKIALDITGLQFSLKGNDLVLIIIETGNDRKATRLSGSVYLRNYPSEYTADSETINDQDQLEGEAYD